MFVKFKITIKKEMKAKFDPPPKLFQKNKDFYKVLQSSIAFLKVLFKRMQLKLVQENYAIQLKKCLGWYEDLFQQYTIV